MPSKKKSPRKQYKRKVQAGRRRRPASSRPSKVATHPLEAMSETLDIMLPELAARLAAVEHLLIERQICSHDDLLRSRDFIDIRRSQQ